MPFDTTNSEGGLAQGANILTFTRWADIVKHVLEALRGEMGVMQIQLWEVTLEHDAMREEMGAR
jgi:tRNA A58 N-methylase Trm61